MKKLFSLASLVALSSAGGAHAATAFTAGDLAVIGYNGSNPDTVAMVTFNGFEAGTSLILTDYGWRSDTNTLRFGGEGYIQATAKRNFAPGEVFVIQREADGAAEKVTPTADFDFAFDVNANGNPQYAPSAAGDGTIVFQGTIDDAAPSWSGTLLYAVNADGTNTVANPNTNGWQANAADSNTSALPAGLVDGTTAIGLVPAGATEFDNYGYAGPRTGTQAELLAAIGDRANWTGQDTLMTFDTTSFTVVPEPAGLSVLALGAGALLARRRRPSDNINSTA